MRLTRDKSRRVGCIFGLQNPIIHLLTFFLMMKRRNKSMWAGLLVLAVVTLSAFSGGPTAAERETRSVNAFTEVSLGGSSHVVLRQGSPQSVVVEASAADLADFETVVKDRQLRLGFHQEANGLFTSKNHGPVMVYLTAPDLTALRVGGSGRLEVMGPLRATALMLAVAGSGDLQVPELTATSLETALAGSGNVLVSGNCPRHEIRLSGSGNVKAQALKTEISAVRLSGSGSAHVNASKSMEARLSGSGNVFVAGGGLLNSAVHGSGRVIKE